MKLMNVCRFLSVGTVVIASAMMSASAMAAEKAAAAPASSDNQIAENRGSDSCGLGWSITKGKSLLGTSTRGSTNASLNPAFSMTSGTSGCEQHSFAKKDSDSVKYIAKNFNSIKADMAEGQGEYLAGLAQVVGCNDGAVSNFQSLAQKNYRSLTNGADAYQTLEHVRAMIQQNPSLSGCSSVSI